MTKKEAITLLERELVAERRKLGEVMDSLLHGSAHLFNLYTALRAHRESMQRIEFLENSRMTLDVIFPKEDT